MIYQNNKYIRSLNNVFCMITDRSSWWYGVAAIPIITGLLWAAWYGGKAGFPLLSAVAGFSLVLSGLLIPVFSICLIMDIKALRSKPDKWNPSKKVYYPVAVLSLFSYMSALIYFVPIVGGVAYLVQRHRETGVP